MDSILESIKAKKEAGELKDNDIKSLIAELYELLDEKETNNEIFMLKVIYTDGDSSGVEDCTEVIDYAWRDIQIVKENVKAIEEHYDYTNSGKSWKGLSEEKLEEFKSKWWFVPDTGKYLSNISEHSIYLKKDSGELFQMSTPWIGFFACFYRIEVIVGGIDR